MEERPDVSLGVLSERSAAGGRMCHVNAPHGHGVSPGKLLEPGSGHRDDSYRVGGNGAQANRGMLVSQPDRGAGPETQTLGYSQTGRRCNNNLVGSK